MENNIKKNKVIGLLIFIVILVALTIALGFISYINELWIRLTVNCIGYLLLGFIAFLFIKKMEMRPDYGFRNGKTYLIGIVIAIVLQLLIGVIPALCGQSLAGEHNDFLLWKFIFQFFYCIMIIGPVEELIFRVYIQDTINDLLPKHKWLGVLIASVLFGFWHIIHGSLLQVLFTTVIGCVFGFAKYFIKNCKYSGVALAHGLYDFLCHVTTILFV